MSVILNGTGKIVVCYKFHTIIILYNIITVEPLLMDTLYKGHNIKNLHVKDMQV